MKKPIIFFSIFLVLSIVLTISLIIPFSLSQGAGTPRIELTALDDAVTDFSQTGILNNTGGDGCTLVTTTSDSNNISCRGESYFKFSLADIPNNATITYAELILTMQTDGDFLGNINLEAYNCTGEWTDGELTASSSEAPVQDRLDLYNNLTSLSCTPTGNTTKTSSDKNYWNVTDAIIGMHSTDSNITFRLNVTEFDTWINQAGHNDSTRYAYNTIDILTGCDDCDTLIEGFPELNYFNSSEADNGQPILNVVYTITDSPYYHFNKTNPTTLEYNDTFYMEINVSEDSVAHSTFFTLIMPNGSYARDIEGNETNNILATLISRTATTEHYKSTNVTLRCGRNCVGNWTWNTTILNGVGGNSNFSFSEFTITDPHAPNITDTIPNFIEVNKLESYSITYGDNVALDLCSYNITRISDNSLLTSSTFSCVDEVNINFGDSAVFPNTGNENFTIKIEARDSSGNVNLINQNRSIEITKGPGGQPGPTTTGIDIPPTPDPIILPLFCGDNICSREENIFSCQADCGTFNLDDLLLNCIQGKKPCLFKQAWFLSTMFFVIIGGIAFLLYLDSNRNTQISRNFNRYFKKAQRIKF